MRKVHAWEASDGKTFTSEAECRLHEIKLKKEAVKETFYKEISNKYTVMASMFAKQDLWRLLAVMTADPETFQNLLGNYIQGIKRLDRAEMKVLEAENKESTKEAEAA